MALFVPIPDGIKLVFRWVLFGIPVTCTLYVTTEDPITETLLGEAAGAAVGWWTGGGRGSFSQDLSLQYVQATQVDVENGLQTYVVPSSNAAGGLTAPSVPGNVALVASLRTPNIGRSYRGRLYLPGATETQVGSNIVSPTDAAAFAANVTSLLNQLITAGFEPVVASKWHANAPRLTGVATPITDVIVNQRVDTQRRRLG